MSDLVQLLPHSVITAAARVTLNFHYYSRHMKVHTYHYLTWGHSLLRREVGVCARWGVVLEAQASRKGAICATLSRLLEKPKAMSTTIATCSTRYSEKFRIALSKCISELAEENFRKFCFCYQVPERLRNDRERADVLCYLDEQGKLQDVPFLVETLKVGLQRDDLAQDFLRLQGMKMWTNLFSRLLEMH